MAKAWCLASVGQVHNSRRWVIGQKKHRGHQECQHKNCVRHKLPFARSVTVNSQISEAAAPKAACAVCNLQNICGHLPATRPEDMPLHMGSGDEC